MAGAIGGERNKQEGKQGLVQSYLMSMLGFQLNDGSAVFRDHREWPHI